jgi:hippurate hydrolase
MPALLDDTAALQADLIRLRRELHQEPETGLDLPRAQEKVLAALDGLPVETSTGRALSSVTAVLRGSSPGPTVLLRADMDALPVTERSGAPYASRIEGRSHACGHDLHTAMLVGAAHLLSARELPGDVIFMFQPGEEGFGGARRMIDEGVLDAADRRPVAAYGLHVLSSLLPRGQFATRNDAILAATGDLFVTVRGRGGHGSQPHRAKDPIPAACEMVTALQTFVTRGFDVFDPVVLTVGSFNAGTKHTVIPGEARFAATIRTFSDATHARVLDGAVEVLRGIAAAHGLAVETEYATTNPVTVNDAAETDFVASTITELYGSERFHRMPHPLTTSEDFSHVLKEVPGTFILLGACPPDRDPATAPFNHAAEAAFDDAVLADGAALLAELATRRLALKTG